MSFSSGQLAQYVSGKLIGRDDVVCLGAEIDSRQPIEGKVFFALHGEHADGHDFVEMAAQNGCSAVVVERSYEVSVPVIVVRDVRKALYDLAKARRVELNCDAVIAVTGSVGKTTTKDILACLLGDRVVASRNSFNNDLGVPITVLDAEGAQFLVAEIGANEVGEIEPLAALVQPDIAILTSVGDAHLEGFGDRKTILQEKAKLLEAVPKGGYVIVPETIDLASTDISALIVTVGESTSADIQVSMGIDEFGFATLSMHGEEVKLSLLGQHNAMNAALGIVAASYANQEVSISELLVRVCNAGAPKGRLRKVEVGEIVFLDDAYNANPTSMRSALELFSGLKANRKVMILGDMLELGTSSHSEHRLLAGVIEKVDADLVVLVGKEMKAAVGSSAAICVENINDLQSITSLLRPRDLVLLKGSRGLCLEKIIDSCRQTKVLEH